jgi:hypothetical protein
LVAKVPNVILSNFTFDKTAFETYQKNDFQTLKNSNDPTLLNNQISSLNTAKTTAETNLNT